jgi:hypothetical protein
MRLLIREAVCILHQVRTRQGVFESTLVTPLS